MSLRIAEQRIDESCGEDGAEEVAELEAVGVDDVRVGVIGDEDVEVVEVTDGDTGLVNPLDGLVEVAEDPCDGLVVDASLPKRLL